MIDEENTKATQLFIRMIDMWFDAMNVKNRLEGQMKRNDFRLPYTSPLDYKVRVQKKLSNDFIQSYNYTHACSTGLGMWIFHFSVAKR